MPATTDHSTLAHRLRVLAIGRRPRATLARILVLVVVCFITFRFVLLPVRIEGISMLPTFHDGQIHLVNRLAFLFHEPQRGNIVAIRFSRPGTLSVPSEMLMKRIIGLPGETVTFHAGRACINGKPLDEPYVKLPCDWEHGPIVCGPDQYYVVGDNRSMPFELHMQGRAGRDRIVGQPLL